MAWETPSAVTTNGLNESPSSSEAVLVVGGGGGGKDETIAESTKPQTHQTGNDIDLIKV